MDTVAKEYPDVSFAASTVDPSDGPQRRRAGLRRGQGSFLVGAAAALKTKTNHIGFIGGNESALITKFEAGYEQGAKAVNPGIKIDDKYLAPGDDVAGFGNPAKGKVAAQAHVPERRRRRLHRGRRLRSTASSTPPWTPGKWAIGVDSDQYNTVGNPAFKPHILTSMVKQVDVGRLRLHQGVQGHGKASKKSYALKDGGVGYSTSGGFVNDIKPKLEEYKKKIEDGSLKVSTDPLIDSST